MLKGTLNTVLPKNIDGAKGKQAVKTRRQSFKSPPNCVSLATCL